MIEIIVLDYLSEKISAEVHMEIPKKDSERYVVLRKADSSRENHVITSMLVVDSYAASMLEAAKLNEEVVAAMDSLPELDEICGVSLTGDYSLPDTASKRYRYQAVYDITHY